MKIKKILSRDEWISFFLLAKNTNISQDWDYGVFRELTSEIVVKRYKIIVSKTVIAIFQVYEKKLNFFPFIKIVYINRGPIIINDKFNFNEILNTISKKYFLIKGHLLIFNPFLPIKDNVIKILQKNFYSGIKSRNYETSFIDLQKDEEVLRANLHSKWRNQLVKSEKNNITISYYINEEKIDIILKEYKKMLDKKQFIGLNPNQLKVLSKIFIKKNKLVYFIAYDNEQNIIGFTIILTFYNSAVYFIGWSSQYGRKLNVSNLLLWNSITYLKRKNYKEFDLGGYDSIKLPGIASFKKRIGGIEKKYTERWIKLY